MKRSMFVLLLVIATLVLVAAVLFASKISQKLGSSTNESGAKISEVKIVDGIPKLFVSGKEMNSSAVNVYYYPPQGENLAPAYGSADWTAKMKVLVDQVVGNNAKLILLNVWWSDLDRSTIRPKNIGDNFNYDPLDNIFSYAQQKNAYIIPIFTLFPFRHIIPAEKYVIFAKPIRRETCTTMPA
jgi:hypothetical protein